MIQRKDGEFSLPYVKRHTGNKVISFYLSSNKPCGKQTLGQNFIKIISDKSNSAAMFLRTRLSDRFSKNTPALLVQSLNTVFTNPV